MRTLAALLALVLVVSVSGQYGHPVDPYAVEKLHPSPVPLSKVVSYYTTSSRCSLRAHVFKIATGKEFCVNPKLVWVRKIITKLNGKPADALA